MFTIRLQMAQGYETGIKALEQRRLWGLPDGTQLRADHRHWVAQRSADAPEAVARLWFSRDQTTDLVHVPWFLLAPGDVELEESQGTVRLADLSEAALQEIYVMTKMYNIQQELARLQAENETLRDQLASMDELAYGRA